MKDTKVTKNRQKKEQIVAELQEKVSKAKGMVFTNYQGLTHKQLEGLKKASKAIEADFVAAKNTLLKLALEQSQKSYPSGHRQVKSQNDDGTLNSQPSTLNFEGPTAALFIYNDIVEPLKLLMKTIKELKLPVIKFGLLEGKLVTDAEVTRIAALPPLPVLQAQLLGQMKAPISGLHRALRWNLQSLVIALNAIQQKKS